VEDEGSADIIKEDQYVTYNARRTKVVEDYLDGSMYEKEGCGDRRGRRQLESDRKKVAML
jgi:hypothetical protein